MNNYIAKPKSQRRHMPRRVLWVLIVFLVLACAAAIVVRHIYFENLKPVSSSQHVTLFTIQSGESAENVSSSLQKNNLIRSSMIFDWYVDSKEVRDQLQAGTYALNPSMSVSQIVNNFINGKIATNLITILPGQRIDQIRAMFIKEGFKAAEVDAALQPAQYKSYEALADKPASSSLEGFLYPDSFQKDTNTTPQFIIKESLDEMAEHLTPSIRTAFAKQGLSVYQGITLASIVEQEVSTPDDRAKVAQVFFKRLNSGMVLGSDVTAYYGAIAAGQSPSTTYDSPYNTLIHKGLPPGPISNVSDSSLQAVANPAKTNWLYFVAGDDGKTHFSNTFAEHQALTQKYCHKLCSGTQ